CDTVRRISGGTALRAAATPRGLSRGYPRFRTPGRAVPATAYRLERGTRRSPIPPGLARRSPSSDTPTRASHARERNGDRARARGWPLATPHRTVPPAAAPARRPPDGPAGPTPGPVAPSRVRRRSAPLPNTCGRRG